MRYGPALQRMMALLQTFDATLETQYDHGSDALQANAFRATLMVAAVSYGFDADLRGDFKALSFPVDDAIYAALIARP